MSESEHLFRRDFCPAWQVAYWLFQAAATRWEFAFGKTISWATEQIIGHKKNKTNVLY